jgi:hypothetical protein
MMEMSAQTGDESWRLGSNVTVDRADIYGSLMDGCEPPLVPIIWVGHHGSRKSHVIVSVPT